MIKATVTIWIRASGPLDGEEMDEIASGVLDRIEELRPDVFDTDLVETELV